MRVRLQIAAVLIAFTALGPTAFGRGADSAEPSSVSDALPKHPIPYKAFHKGQAKPKRKPSTAAHSAPAPVPAGGAALTPNPAPPAPGSPPPQAAPKAPANTAPTPLTANRSPALAPPIAAPPAAPPKAAGPPAAAPRQSQPAAPPPPPLAPPQPGSRLQPGQAIPADQLEAFIDGQVSRAMVGDHIAGVAVAVVQNGQLVVEKGYDETPSARTRRIDPRATLVRLGSGSQIFTWIAALKAAEQGKLKLDAPVNAYLPDELKLPDEGFAKPILFRHLMTHTAGFEDRAFGRRYVYDADKLVPLDQALSKFRPRRVRAAGLLSIPSDYDPALAGAVVARAEGRPFDQVVEGEILKPLALSHTSFREPYPAAANLPEPLSQGLANTIGEGFRWTGRGYELQPFAYGQSLSPALSASTTADDMARLMIALLSNGKLGDAAILNPVSSARLRSPLQRPAPGVEGWAYGLAMQRTAGGFEVLSDVGAAPAFRTSLSLAPGLNLGVFVVADTDTGGPLTQDLSSAIVQRFYGARAPVQGEPATSPVDATGAYLSAKRAYHGLEAFADRLMRRSKLTQDGAGGLVLSDARGAHAFNPTPIAGQFQDAEGRMLLIPAANGDAPAYVLGSGGGAGERIGGLQRLGVLAFWASLTGLMVIATFAGLFIHDRNDPRASRSQTLAHITQIGACIVWCVAFAAFGLFVAGGLSTERLMFDWPNNWLVLASWAALLAGALSLAMVLQLPGAWREARRIHGWSIWRKLRHTTTVGVFLAFTAILAAWGALEPWSS